MAEPENRKETGGNRDKTGRFTKGKSGNPGGRPKKPEVIEKYADEAPDKLRAIALDPDTPKKIQADIWKFFYEAQYGKAKQAVDVDGTIENTGATVVRFEGELAEWAK